MSTTPYCKTCHKAGKSYHEYTNHWTRETPEKDSNIVCPVILNTVCNYCKEKGHWVKYCPQLSIKQTEHTEPIQPFIQPSNSWANILKRGLPKPLPYKHNVNTNYDTDFVHSIQTASGNGQITDYTNCINIDVSICDITEMSRPPSPDYPPPYYSTTPDHPPPKRSTTPDYPPP